MNRKTEITTMIKVSIVLLSLVVLFLSVEAVDIDDVDMAVEKIKGSAGWEKTDPWVKKVCNRGLDSLRDIHKMNLDLVICSMYLETGGDFAGMSNPYHEKTLRGVFKEFGTLLSEDNGYEEVLRRAEFGDAEAQFLQGHLILFSTMTENDTMKVHSYYKWILRSAEAGFVPAMMNLAHDRGEVEWYKNAARRGNLKAHRELAEHYTIVDENEYEAHKWYLWAARKGDRCSQRELGDVYRFGLLGQTKNQHKAAQWYRLAADAGDVDAQYKLGKMHEEGIGVLQDDREAILLYRAASQKLHLRAMQRLGEIYMEGRGVDDDLAGDVVRAHAYLNLILSLRDFVLFGDAGLSFVVTGPDENIVAVREKLAKRMTRAQILEAQSLAKSWHPLMKKAHEDYVSFRCN